MVEWVVCINEGCVEPIVSRLTLLGCEVVDILPPSLCAGSGHAVVAKGPADLQDRLTGADACLVGLSRLR